MNKKIVSMLAVCALALSGLTYSAFAQATPAPAPGTPGGHHRHSNIKAAIASLQRAEDEMKAAAHDYGGHRVEALAACDAAIAQLNLALQFANEKTPAAPAAPNSQ